MSKAHSGMFRDMSASPFSFPFSISLIDFLDPSFFHFYTLFIWFRKDDDFEVFFLDKEFLCWGFSVRKH